ncbi:tetratricopeptide repeat protein [Methylophilus sp. 'Pure River']|uniref:tetratricopeptide repeat protein n=1 Tax=Methylophilus sp. 'Pure River' TaxID=3377117 RepID=UPI00398F2D51
MTNTPASQPVFTFFYTDNCERQALAPVADEIASRGYLIQWSTDSRQYAEVGVYCEHACKPNAGFSVVLLHDLAQRHDIWPHFWHHEPWTAFDMGIVPGPAWVERWQTQTNFKQARPKLGVFDLGWPKADLVYRNQETFKQEAQKLREQLGLKYEHSILYAPSWENHGKQDEFVQALKDLPVNLLLKQAPWSDKYRWVLNNIDAMDALHRNCADNVYVVDREVSIMYCLGLADVMVSDESSVLTEALLLDVPGIAVTDWLIPDTNPPRPASVPYDYVIKTVKADLRRTVEHVLENAAEYQQQITQNKQHQFAHLGQSATLIADNILAALAGHTHLPTPALKAQVDIDRTTYQQAEKLAAEGDMKLSTQMMLELIKQESSCWEPYNDLGTLLVSQGQFEDAELLLEKAVLLAQENPAIPLSNLTEVYCLQQKADKALATLAKLSKYTPNPVGSIPHIRRCMETMF